MALLSFFPSYSPHSLTLAKENQKMSTAGSISATRTNKLLHKAETTIGVDCLAPERRGDKVTVDCTINATLQHKWNCILRNKDPQIEIQLSWTCQLKYAAFLAPPTPFQSVRIVSREGRQLCGALISGLGAEAIHSGGVSSSVAQSICCSVVLI